MRRRAKGSDRPRFFAVSVAILVLLSLPGIGRPAPKSSLSDVHKGQRISHAITTTEWLGPLSPIALSPFFGLTILSGLATFGQDYVTGHNALLSAETPLKNPTVFWVFLSLTVLTSLPKLTKVSKALAESVDWIETYSTVIALVVIRIAATGNGPDSAELDLATVNTAGVASMSFDVVMIVAMAINIIVVNAVKFFFEMLIWITPIPMLDAAFEVGNKLVCAVLMVIYTFSPLLATVVNLVILAVCLLVFEWVRRQTVFYRTMAFDPIASAVWKRWGKPKGSLVVFPVSKLLPFQATARCVLTKSEAGWMLTQYRFLRSPLTLQLDSAPKIKLGLFCNRLMTEHGDFLFSRRFNANMADLATGLSIVDIDSAEESKLGFA